jgi:hypothetical protein
LAKSEFGQQRPGGVILDPADLCPNRQESCGPGAWTRRNLDSSGDYYMTLLGPAKTVEKHEKAFKEWIASFK